MNLGRPAPAELTYRQTPDEFVDCHSVERCNYRLAVARPVPDWHLRGASRYRDCLGLDADVNGLWRQGAGLTVFATFESETGYFGSRAQQTMLNFRVRDLDARTAC